MRHEEHEVYCELNRVGVRGPRYFFEIGKSPVRTTSELAGEAAMNHTHERKRQSCVYAQHAQKP